MIDFLDGAMSTSTPRATRASSRQVKPNPQFSPQPGIAKTIGERARAVSMSSPAQLSRENGKKDLGALLEGRINQLEAKVTKTEEENEKLRDEVAQLRRRLEEEEAARKQVEEKLRVIVEVDGEEREKIKTDLLKEKERVKRLEEEKLKEVKEGLEKEIKEVAQKLTNEKSRESSKEEEGGAGNIEDPNPPYKCIVITDSNGERATQESIKDHIPQDKRADYDIRVVVAYRLEDAYDRIKEGKLDVENAYVIIDNVTNNIRGGKRNDPEPADMVTDRVAALREVIMSNSAKAVVVCQPKPMKRVDVRPASLAIHEYLVACGKGGFGCRTQIRKRYLRDDGFHIQPKFDSILDRTYACALLGIHVPDPTPFGDLTPEFERRRWENQYPRLGGRGQPKS